MQRRSFLLGASTAQAASTAGIPFPADRVRTFHRAYPVCDMLGLNLTHPRFLIDNVDLGQRHEDTCRGDFLKFKDWGLRVVMCKGGPREYSDEFAALWQSQPERRAGKPEPLHLTLAAKNPTQSVLAVLDRFLVAVEANPDKVLLVRRASDLDRAHREGKVAVLMGSNRSDWFADTP